MGLDLPCLVQLAGKRNSRKKNLMTETHFQLCMKYAALKIMSDRLFKNAILP